MLVPVVCVKLHQSSLITTRARVEVGSTFMTSSTWNWLDCIRQSHTESLGMVVQLYTLETILRVSEDWCNCTTASSAIVQHYALIIATGE